MKNFTSSSLYSVIFIFLTLSAGILVIGCKSSEEDPKVEVKIPDLTGVKQSTPVEVTGTSAEVVSQVTSSEDKCLDGYGIVWSATNATPTLADNKLDLGKSCGPFPLSYKNKLETLSKGSTVYVRAFATNAGGTGYGTVQQIKPGGTPPKFTGANIRPQNEKITSTEIFTGAVIEGAGESSISQHGFVYAVGLVTPTFHDGRLELGPFKGAIPSGFSGTITGLKPGTLYTVRPYAINSGGISYGWKVAFETLK